MTNPTQHAPGPRLHAKGRAFAQIAAFHPELTAFGVTSMPTRNWALKSCTPRGGSPRP